MPGFNQQQLNNRARNGNSVTVLIGDVPIAFAQSVDHNFDLGAEGLYGVGSAKPQEIQQLRDSMSITVSNFSLTQNGLNLIQPGQAAISSLLANNKFNLAVIDGLTNQTLFTYVGCVAQGYSQNIPSNQPVTENITFMAMDVLDNTGQSILTGQNALSLTA